MALALAVLFALRKLLRKIPGALVVLIVGIAVSAALNLSDRGVEVVGTVPTGYGFVASSAVTFHHLVDMVPGALGIVVLAFASHSPSPRLTPARTVPRFEKLPEAVLGAIVIHAV